MSLARFKGQNHPQQVAERGAVDDVDDRATHPVDFGPLDDRFGFTVDVAAAAHNAKCERFYDLAANGLEQSWAGETVWCNPPFSDIKPWVQKAWDEYRDCRAIVMLLPANRTEQSWWQRMVEPYRDCENSPLRVEFLEGRIRFMKKGQTAIGPNERPPFGCCVLIWTPPLAWTRDAVLGGLFDENAREVS